MATTKKSGGGGARSKPYAYMCGTPRESCTGSLTTVNAGMRGSNAIKAHTTPEQAFACHKNHLVALGWKPIDSRALEAPDGSTVRVLTKSSRFGAKLRNGKEGTRNMPHVRGHRAGCRGGTIVST